MNSFNSNLDKLLNVLNQLEKVDLTTKKGLYYDAENNKIKAFHSRWFITSWGKRSEDNYTKDALSQINSLFERSINDVKQALQNPSISKKKREDLVAKAEYIQTKIADRTINKMNAFENLRIIANERKNREVALAINKLLNKFNHVKQIFEDSLNPLSKVTGTLISLEDARSISANEITYNPTTEKFQHDKKKLSEEEMKKQIEQSLYKLQTNIELIQEHIVDDLNPFENLENAEKATPIMLLRQLEKQKNLHLKEDPQQIKESIKEFQYELKKMEKDLIRAAPGFNHLISKLSKKDQEIYRNIFVNFSNHLINNLKMWSEILNRFENVTSESKEEIRNETSKIKEEEITEEAPEINEETEEEITEEIYELNDTLVDKEWENFEVPPDTRDIPLFLSTQEKLEETIKKWTPPSSPQQTPPTSPMRDDEASR